MRAGAGKDTFAGKNRVLLEQVDAPGGIREVWAYAGHALFLAQGLEEDLVTLLGLWLAVNALSYLDEDARESPTTAEVAAAQSAFDSAEQDALKKTLGQLIRSLQKSGFQLDPTLEEHLTKALDARNRLAHHFFDGRAADLLRVEGRRRLKQELAEIQERLRSAKREILAIAQEGLRGFGITEDVTTRVEELMRAGASEEQISREIRRLVKGPVASDER